MSRVVAINRAVNNAVRGVERVSAMGGIEGWVRPSMTRWGLVGDCKNFAVEKRERLIEAGVSASQLRYAVVYRRDIGLHAVLVVRVNDRDYVLDNRSVHVLPWQDAPYTWVKVNEPGEGWKQVLNAEFTAASLSVTAPNVPTTSETAQGPIAFAADQPV
ncbi:transglutaminase-like cysteine peptidase [Brevundimonas sp. LM2]|uniref:transglutaminase-like cysteine peptidase n=1 Tax=Brevundimonas sp. LM2 TaxID=1938605 RepID=UPI0015C57318|nr:transglutaminase-like cysteine peptidase [Brevundimonas sp. LM2]